jgi:hypothetical protein
MGTSDATLNLYRTANAIDLAGTALHAVINVDHPSLSVLDLEDGVRTYLDAPSASSTPLGHQHKRVPGLLDVYLVIGLDQQVSFHSSPPRK